MNYNRQLSSIEQAMEILNHQASSYSTVTVCRIRGLLDEEILRQSLDLIQRRHPRLNSRIIRKLDSLYFESGTMKIPLRVVNKQYSEQWQEVVLQELNQKIESDKYLLRAVLLRIENENNLSYLITTIHHAISDGSSRVNLHSEILTYCQKIATGKAVEVTSLSPIAPLRSLLPKSMQGQKGVANRLLFLSKAWLKKIWHHPKTWDFEKCVPIELRRCGMAYRRLNEEQTTQLINCCRKNQTTVQGALCAVMMLVAASRISTDTRTNVPVSCRSAVNLRQRLQPEVSNENMGVLVSSIVSFHNLKPDLLFWDLARDVRKKLEAGLKSNDIFSLAMTSKGIFKSLLARPNEAPMTVNITNLGRVNIPQVYGSLELEEISGFLAQAVFGGIYTAVSTFRGKMFLNFMFSEPAISQKSMEALANTVVNCLVEVGENEKLNFTSTMFSQC